jgi:prolycopene isomerase
VGVIARELAEGLVEKGGQIKYKANVTQILMEAGKVMGVQLSNGTIIRAKKVISNATRWDTFGEKILKMCSFAFCSQTASQVRPHRQS